MLGRATSYPTRHSAISGDSGRSTQIILFFTLLSSHSYLFSIFSFLSITTIGSISSPGTLALEGLSDTKQQHWLSAALWRDTNKKKAGV